MAANQTAIDVSGTSEAGLSDSGSPLIQSAGPNNHSATSQPSGANDGKPMHYNGKFGDSVTYTPESLHSPGIFRSDFKMGILKDGVTRAGAIISYVHHKYYQTGFTDSITFDKFTINGNLISGSIMLTRLSSNSFSRIVRITTSLNGAPANAFNSSNVRINDFNSGTAGTVTPASYTYSESGSSNSHNGSTGTSDTSLIKIPLVFARACAITAGRFPVSGSIDHSSSSSKKHRLIDYGNGSCDLTFTITIGTLTKTITLTKP